MFRTKGAVLLLITLSTLVVAAYFWQGESEPGGSAHLLVVTEVLAEAQIDWRSPARSRLVAISLESGERRILTDGFAAARSPEVSVDGRRLVFAGRIAATGPWQIWEMRIDGSNLRRLTSTHESETEPVYLWDGSIAFVAPVADDGDQWALHTMGADGCCRKRISFHPASDGPPVLLQEGRLLYAREMTGTSPSQEALLAMRHDGTEASLYYRTGTATWFGYKPRETPDGLIILVEKNAADAAGGNLVSISQQRPLHSRVNLAPDRPGSFHSAYPAADGAIYVSYRERDGDGFALHELDTSTGEIRLIVQSDGWHVVEPVLVGPRPRPAGYLSLVDEDRTTGWLFCLDADHSTQPTLEGRRSDRVRILTTSGPLGSARVEADGSFYVEVPADMPLQLETVDEAGAVVRGPSEWIWVRPNEQRGCIGCHEDREIVPQNRQPIAVTRPADPIPAHELSAGIRPLQTPR